MVGAVAQCYQEDNVAMCSIERGQIYGQGSDPNVSYNGEEDNSIIRAVAPVVHTVFLSTGQWP